MKNKIPYLSMVIVVLLGLASLCAASMSSPSYRIPISEFSSGGAALSSDNYQMDTILGQPSPLMVDNLPPSSASYKLYPGFWNMVEDEGNGEVACVSITKPNGGEHWNRNSQRVIYWSANGCQGNLKITLWQNGGLIGTIADGVNPVAGSYSWKVGQYIGATAPLGTGYTIKIEDKVSTLVDESDGPFSIVKISVKAPNGGESWKIGTTQNITWVSQYMTGNLRIVLFKNGVKVGNIVDSIDPALRTYSWSVGQCVGGTAAAGSGYSLQIREIGTDAGDRSDGVFTLTVP